MQLILHRGGQTGKYQAGVLESNVDKARVEIRGRAMGQGRRQTERIPESKAGSERQTANDQGEESTVPGKTQEDKLGKKLGNVSQGKTRLRSECM